MLLRPRGSWDEGLVTVGYHRMKMAELLVHPLLPALSPFDAQSTQENFLLCRHMLGALLVTAAAAHQLITPFCCWFLCAQKPGQPPPLCSCLGRWADSTWWQREPTRHRSSEPSRERKYREGSWETLLGGMWGNAFSKTHDISQLPSFL